MSKPKIDKAKLNILKEQLEHGDLQKIANQLGLSGSTIYKVFNGEIRNIQVIDKAISLVKYRNSILNQLNTNKK